MLSSSQFVVYKVCSVYKCEKDKPHRIIKKVSQQGSEQGFKSLNIEGILVSYFTF